MVWKSSVAATDGGKATAKGLERLFEALDKESNEPRATGVEQGRRV